MEKQRLEYIDIAKFLCIFLLFVEHTGNWTALSGRYNYIKIWICSFHMPAFFILYGMVASNHALEWKKFIVKRIKSLVVPYIIWAMIYAPSITNNFLKGVLYGTNQSLGYAETNQVLWFLTAMFTATIIYQAILWINSYLNDKYHLVICVVEIVICVLLSLVIKETNTNIWGSLWNIDIAFTGTAFILLGSKLRSVCTFIKEKSKGTIVFLGSFCVILGFFLAQLDQPKEFWVTIMALGYYGKYYILFMAIAVLNTVGICCWSMLLEKITVLAWLGEGSLFLMAIHYIIFPYTVTLCTRMTTHNIAIAINNAGICTLISIPLLAMINKYIPVLKGK